MNPRCVLLVIAACDAPEPDPPEAPWQEREVLLDGRRRLEAAATANGTRLVVLGGFSTSPMDVPPLEISREVLEFDPFMQMWTKLEIDAPEAWTHAGLVAAGGTLYLLGGLSGTTFQPSGNAYRLRPGEDTWEPLSWMPEGYERGAAAIVASPGHIFLFGGEGAGGPLSTVLDYVIANNEWRWRELPDLPTPRSHAAVMRDDDGTFIIAGGIGITGPLGDVYALPQNASEWELREPMPTPRGACAYGEMYGQLVCAGGEIANGATTDVVELYDPDTNVWTTSTPMPIARAGAAAAVVASHLYVVGGAETPLREPTSTVLEFDLLDTIPR